MNGDIIFLTDADAKSGPPPTDMSSREASLLRSSFLDALKLGIAIGLAWAIVFLLISLIVWISGQGQVLDFFKAIYPGFAPSAIGGILIGFAWSFLYGLIFGVIIGVVYNSLVRKSVLDSEGFEMYA